MSGNWKDNLELLSIALNKRGTPLSLFKKNLYGWASEFNLPERGEVVLYTGQLYQLLPYVETLLEKRKRFESIEKMIPKGLFLKVYSALDLGALLSQFSVSKGWAESFYGSLKAIVKLLKAHGVEIAYPKDHEYYPGTLAHDLGFKKAFLKIAERLINKLKETGAKVIITTDPHTTYLLKVVYPEVLGNSMEFEVKHWLEVLAEKRKEKSNKVVLKAIVHEGCVWARGLKYSGILKKVLESFGIEREEIFWDGELTRCCGGPIEGLFPEKAVEIAKKRWEELSKEGLEVLVLCPICYLNFSRLNPPLKPTDFAYKLSQFV